jgi:prepilin-type N-terminal cleavage/methylation domain-containing protein
MSLPPGPPGTRRTRGMTLLEVVVALTITGLAVTAGYAALASVMDQRDRADHALDGALRVANERRTLRTWLAGARLSIEAGSPDFNGLDGTYDGRTLRATLSNGRTVGPQADDALRFLTSAATPLAPDGTMIRLYVDRDTLTPVRGLAAELRDWRTNRGQVVELDSTVSGLDLRYYSIPLGDRGWLPSWVSRTLLPSGIELTLTGDSLPPLLALPMLVAVGATR